MSDAYYQERSARRTRILLMVGGIVVVVICIVAAVASVFYDACTKSFDGSPQAVVEAYVEAVRKGDSEVAQECWEHETFYELDAGCSEICLSRFYGAEFEVGDVVIGQPVGTSEGRSNLSATVPIVCTDTGDEHVAEILLDSVGSNLPWRHWTIIQSTLGGSTAEQWCK
jgi:hypothetical protein